MIVLIAGGRDYKLSREDYMILDNLNIDMVIHGGAPRGRGTSNMKKQAVQYGLKIIEVI